MHILFVQTGGTIDKDYPKSQGGWAFEFGDPATTRILEKLNPSFDFEIKTACQKDSLEIDEQDRSLILQMILAASTNQVIITHGTDTLLDTAQFLAQDLDASEKVIVLTGAMRPERFSNSEAPINLGMAIAGVQILGPGVYVCMHGVIGKWDEISRNQEGKFYHS
ncbi:MAG: asparaginase domain-containing protein [Bacteroidota bacterium]